LIYSAVALLVVSVAHFKPLTDLLAYWTDGVAQTMNAFVRIPQRLPNYLLENLNFDVVEVILLSAFMLLVYKLFKVKETAWLKAVAACSFVFFSYATARSFSRFTSSRMHVHSVARHTVLSATQGQTAYVLADPDFKRDTLAYQFHLKNYFIDQGIKKIVSVDLPGRSENARLVVNWKNQRLGIDSQVFSEKANFSLIRAKQYPKIQKLVTSSGTTFILSQELGFKTKKQWELILGATQNPTIDLTQSGAVEFE
jgi:competence protein ComEC